MGEKVKFERCNSQVQCRHDCMLFASTTGDTSSICFAPTAIKSKNFPRSVGCWVSVMDPYNILDAGFWLLDKLGLSEGARPRYPLPLLAFLRSRAQLRRSMTEKPHI